MRYRLAMLVVAAAALALVPAATAAPIDATKQSGGAAGLVAAVVQVDDTLNELTLLSNIGSIEVVTVKDSFNNVLRNSPILSNNVITLRNFLNDNTVCVAGCDALKNFLNNNNIAISDVVAVDVLSGGDITVFVQD